MVTNRDSVCPNDLRNGDAQRPISVAAARRTPPARRPRAEAGALANLGGPRPARPSRTPAPPKGIAPTRPRRRIFTGNPNNM